MNEKTQSHRESTPLRICSFESRRAAEMTAFIEKQGGVATVAPSMQEIPLDDNPDAFSFAEKLFEGKIDVVIFLTGVGARSLLQSVETKFDRQKFFAALNRCCIVVRGPKPVAVLREWGVRVDLRAPEPNTWREVLAVIDAVPDIAGKTVAVQEYGKPSEELYVALKQQGAAVIPVPVYRWAMPDDLRPLHDAIHSTNAGEFDVLMFTSANQLSNVLEAADSLSLRDEWLVAAARCVIASIGPTASEAIRKAGLPVDMEASPPKMGHLVLQTFEAAAEILRSKQA